MVAKVRTNCYIIYVNNLTRTLNMHLELSYTRPIQRHLHKEAAND